LVPTNTAGNQFEPILREIFCGKQFQPKRRDIGSNQYDRKLVPTNTAGKSEPQGIDSYKYGGKLIPNNTAGRILRKKVTPNTAEGGKLVPTKTGDSNQYGGKMVPTNAVGNT